VRRYGYGFGLPRELVGWLESLNNIEDSRKARERMRVVKVVAKRENEGDREHKCGGLKKNCGVRVMTCMRG